MRKSNIAEEPEPPSRELEALVLTHIQPLLWQHLHTFLYVPTVLLCGSCFLARHYPPLSSVSGIEKGGSLPEYGGKWASSLSSSDLSWSFHHSWHCLASLFLDLPLLFATFCERNKSNEWDGAGSDCSSDGRSVREDTDSHGVSFPQERPCRGKTRLTSEQWKLIQRSCRDAAMRGVSQVGDSAI